MLAMYMFISPVCVVVLASIFSALVSHFDNSDLGVEHD